jgi:transposase, IS5 family
MGQARLQETGEGSFYGDYLYDRIVPQGHFLRKLRDLVPWQRYTYRLLKYYRGKGKVGRPPIDPAIVFKMLLLSYLYNLSERQTEEFCNLHLAAKYFLGLAIDEHAPDHSTLTVFKQRLLENGKLQAYEGLLQRVIADAQEAGITFGSLQLIDSTHSDADVNTAKDRERADEGDEPRDPDARWGCKGSYRVTDEQGQRHTYRRYFYGYKAHVSMNREAQMITSLIPSPGNAYDGQYLTKLIAQDLGQGLTVQSCAADRGYDDTENHYWLEQHGIQNAIHLNRYRTHKKDRNREVWISLKGQPWYPADLAQRYQIERKFGEAKKYHGLARCRYLGWERYGVQAYLTAIALNLKQLIRGLTGVSLRGPTPIST